MLAEANREIRLALDTRRLKCFDLQERVLLAQRRLHHDDAD